MIIPASARTLAAPCALAFNNRATRPVTGNPDFAAVSKAQDTGIGCRAAGKVHDQYGISDNPALQCHVGNIGLRRAGLSHRAASEPGAGQAPNPVE